MGKPISVVGGTTTASRRVLAAATGATAAPTLPTDGYAIYGADWIKVYAAFNAGATACSIVPWFYSPASGAWYAGNAIALAASGNTWALTEIRGEDRVYLQVASVTGGGNIDAWAAYTYDSYTGL